MTREEKDKAFLEYARTRNFTFDPKKGEIYNGLAKNLGTKYKKNVLISFTIDGKNTGMSRARALWLFVHGSVPEGFEVGHGSIGSYDDSIDNLELSTRSQRSEKIERQHGWTLAARENYSKLTLEMVNEARRLVRDPKISYGFLAKKYGVSKPNIIFAVQGRTWKDASEPPFTETKSKSVSKGKKKLAAPVVRTEAQKLSRKKADHEKRVALREATNPGRVMRRAPKVEKEVYNEEAYRVATSMLKNNYKISNDGIIAFLRMRRISTIGVSDKKLNEIRNGFVGKIETTLNDIRKEAMAEL